MPSGELVLAGLFGAVGLAIQVAPRVLVFVLCYLHIREGDELDEARFAAWVKQATALPGWVSGGPS